MSAESELAFVATIRDEASSTAKRVRQTLSSLGGPTKPATTEVRVDTSDVKAAGGRIARTFTGVVDASETAGRKSGQALAAGIEKAKAAIPKIGKAIGAGLAAAAAAGVAAGMGALDVGAANAKLTAQLNLTKAESASIGKTAGELYAGNYGGSLEDVNTAIAGVRQNLGKLNGSDLSGITANVLSIADAFDQDSTAISASAAQIVRSGLAKNAAQALDIITVGFQQGADKSGDLLDTFTEYGTQFRKLGIGGAQAVGLFTQGLRAGARDTDTIADTLKEFSIRAVDGSTTSAAGFALLGLNAKKMTAQIAKGGTGASAGLETVLDKLRAIKDPVIQGQAAVALFGTKAEDLGAALFALHPETAAAGLGKVAGAAQKVNDTLGATPSSQIESFKRTVQGAFVRVLGGAVLPKVTEFATYLSTTATPAIAKLQDVADVTRPVFDKLGDAVDAVTGFLGDHTTALKIVAGIITAVFIPAMIRAGVEATISAAKQIAASVGTKLAALQSAAAFGLSVAATVAGWILMGAQAMLGAARMAAAWLIALGPIGLVIAVVALVVGLVIKYWDEIKGATVAAWNAVSGAVVAAWEWIKSTVSGAISWVVGFVKSHWVAIVGVLTGPIGLAVALVIKHWDTIKSTFTNGIAAVIGFAKALPGKIVGAVGDLGAKLWGWATTGFRRLADAERAGISTVVGYAKEIPGKILGAVGDLGSTLYDSGVDMIQGLLNGAGSILPKIGEFMLDKVPGWIRGPFKKALGIHSPSKEFAGYGKNLMQGLAVGMTGSQATVRQALAQTADVVAGFGGTAQLGMSPITVTRSASDVVIIRHEVAFSGDSPKGVTAGDVADVIARDPRSAARLEAALAPARTRRTSTTLEASR